ncbi:hypothetical protein DFQ29_004667 [Apophysomyces sp. BC1021]|nr:hypothetical protein DFQ29_004667 [Apophysomyces sp. BC1021]
MTTRTLAELEQDIANLEQSLFTASALYFISVFILLLLTGWYKQVSEIRSSLKHFSQLVQEEEKKPNYVNAFTDRLTTVKRELNRLSSETEGLKGTLEYAQQAAEANTFDWPMIKQEIDKDMAEQMNRYEAEKDKPKEVGAVIKSNVDAIYRQISSVVPGRPSSLSAVRSSFITTHIHQWMTSEKPQHVLMHVSYDTPERETFAGSICRVKVSIFKALTAILDLEYDHTSNSLVVHQYEMRSPKEDKPFWEDSQHLIFQRLDLLINAALNDMTLTTARESLFCILHWLSSYYNLFVEPCCRCHKRLQFDSPQYKYLPPIVRTWDQKKVANQSDRNLSLTHNTVGLAYHIRCFIERGKVTAQ